MGLFFFFIQSATLCHLIRTSSPLTFKVIADRNILIAILLIVFWLFCSSSLFFTSSFSFFSCGLMISFSGMHVLLSF